MNPRLGPLPLQPSTSASRLTRVPGMNRHGMPLLTTPTPGTAETYPPSTAVIKIKDVKIPRYVPVCCGNMYGYYDVFTSTVITPDGKRLDTTAFELYGGNSSKKWRRSIVVQLEGGESVTIGTWLENLGIEYKLRMVPIINGEEISPEHVIDASALPPRLTGAKRPHGSAEDRSSGDVSAGPSSGNSATMTAKESGPLGNISPSTPTAEEPSLSDLALEISAFIARRRMR